MRINSNISLILILTTLVSCFSNCTSTKNVSELYYVYENVPYDDWEYKTVTKSVPVEEKYEVDKYELVKPYFPYERYKTTKIAVLPFTSSDADNMNAGIEIAEEVEYELIKRIDNFQKKPASELKNYLANQILNNEMIGGITRNDIDLWYVENTRPLYEIVNRTELEMLVQEANVTTSNYTNKLRNNLTSIDGLIIGHVKALSRNYASFIFKAVDVNTSKIIFTQRFEGEYNQAINNAVDVFFFNIQSSGEKIKKIRTKLVKKDVQERKKVKKYKKEKVKKYRTVQKNEFDKDKFNKNMAIWVPIGLVVFLVTFALAN